MPKIQVRPQEVDDAQRFFEILNNKNFTFWDSRPSSIKEEKNFIKATKKWAKNNYSYNNLLIL